MAEVPKEVIQKLVIFTAAMVIAPLTSFFTVKYLLGFNSILSGGLAALVANIVLIGYIVAAFAEDTTKFENVKEKKEQ